MSKDIKPVKIGGKLVGPDQPVYIVLEIGVNHNGFLHIAKKLIDLAVMASADAVKFQTRTVDIVYAGKLDKPRVVPKAILKNAIERGALPEVAAARLVASNFENSTEGDQKHCLEFTLDEYQEIDRYCHAREISWFTSCWDLESLARMEFAFPHLPCHKIASPCNEDDELIRAMRKTGKPLIMSTGMTDLSGVKDAVGVAGTDNLVLLHCTSVYPSGIEEGDELLRLINLRGIDTLRRTFDVPVGFSSHDSGIQPAYAACARGACMIEKHVTLEPRMYGSDQGASLDPMDTMRLCRMIRELPTALGDGNIVIYPGEEEVAKKLRRVRRKRQ